MTDKMNGILNIFKPPGMTSFDVVSYLRGILKISKIGHAGTLDPAAAGVLPVCIGKATRAVEFMMEKDKVYRAELTMGIETDTQDSTGKVINIITVDVQNSQIYETINSFKGRVEQIPPMYSAIKKNGVRLYNIARKGGKVERKPRIIHIYDIGVINIKGSKVLFDIKCSKGTYIRTLCADIGKKLGCGAHLSFLLRMRAGKFGITEAISLETVNDLVDRGKIDSVIHCTDRVLLEYNAVYLNEQNTKRFINGVFIDFEQNMLKTGDIKRVYNHKKQFVALGEVIKRDKYYLKSRKRFI